MNEERKEAYKNKMQAKYEQGKAELDLLKAKAREQMADGQMKAQEDLAEMDSRLETIKSKIQAAGEKADEGVEQLKEGADKAWQEFSDSLSALRKKFS